MKTGIQLRRLQCSRGYQNTKEYTQLFVCHLLPANRVISALFTRNFLGTPQKHLTELGDPHFDFDYYSYTFVLVKLEVAITLRVGPGMRYDGMAGPEEKWNPTPT